MIKRFDTEWIIITVLTRRNELSKIFGWSVGVEQSAEENHGVSTGDKKLTGCEREKETLHFK